MKKIVLTLTFSLFIGITCFSQTLVPVSIILKEGETVLARHFGQAECDGNQFYTGYIMLRGKYLDTMTEMKDYSSISKLELVGFTEAPAQSVGNQKGKIIVHKKSGLVVQLDDAELVVSCLGSDELYNQIKVQLINPITEKVVEKAIATNEISYIIFR